MPLSLVLVLAALSAQAGPIVLVQWKAELDDPQGWPTGEDAGVATEIRDGWYRLASKSEAGGNGVKPLSIDRTADYTISALLRHDGTTDDTSYGLLWDLKDGNSFYALLLSPRGGFSVVRVLGGTVTFLVPWERSTAVEPRQGPNLVSVSRTGDNLQFGVNGETVAILGHESVNGPYIGFMVLGAETLAVDWICFAREGT